MQPMTPEDPQSQTSFIPTAASAPHAAPDSTVQKPDTNQPFFYYTTDQEDDLHLPPGDGQEDQMGGPSSPFVLPFQHSGAMPPMPPTGNASSHSMAGTTSFPATP